MGYMLIITQPAFAEAEVNAVVTAALAVLGLRGGAIQTVVGTFVRRAKTEQDVTFVRLVTEARDSMPAAGLARALESALAAAQIEDTQVQVLEEHAHGTVAHDGVPHR